MALEIIKNINVDFYDNQYVMLNAKQYDDKSRLFAITCYNQGSIFNISASKYAAYIKYRKADEKWVLNSCTINSKNQVLVELTGQMLAASGVCYVDLFIVNKGTAKVNYDTGEIVTIDGSSVLTTKAFYVDVQESAFDNSLIESTDAYSGLTNLLSTAHANYQEVIDTAKSYAIGTDNQVRENDKYDNAKYYYEQSKINANAASESAKSASDSASSASDSANAASDSAKSASDSANAASDSATASADSAMMAKSYAVGETGIRDGENTDNAKYYCVEAGKKATSASDSEKAAKDYADSAKNYSDKVSLIIDDLGGVFLPDGTIEFSELKTKVENGLVKIGYTYNISNSFITDDTFEDGGGLEYPAGTNVYYTTSGKWDCLAGSYVVGIKGDNEDSYRKGSVNITAENVGAVSVSDIATVDEVKEYLGI